MRSDKDSFRRVQAEVPEPDGADVTSEDQGIRVFMYHSKVGYRRWNCQCDKFHQHDAELRHAIQFL